MDFRRIFRPTPEEAAADEKYFRELYEELCKDKGCGTCKNCKHVYRYPGFITAEECVCTVGLTCDTVLYSIKNCKKYEQMKFGEKR